MSGGIIKTFDKLVKLFGIKDTLKADPFIKIDLDL